MRTGNKRYICSFVKRNIETDKLEANVVVISALNETLAKAYLCGLKTIPPILVKKSYKENRHLNEGIKSIRLSDTNTYEGETEDEYFRSHSEA